MSTKTGLAVSRPPVIACNLDPVQMEKLSTHPSQPDVRSYSDEAAVWEIPRDADILFTFFRGWAAAPKQKPEGWPYNLKWIQIASAGIDAFPDWVFEGPPVTTGRGISAEAIAEYVVAAVFAHEKKMFDDLLVHSAGKWVRRTLNLVSGKSVGIYGFGAIGRRTAQKLQALGMNVSAVRRNAPEESGEVRFFSSLKDMVAEVDHVVLAVPLTDATRLSVNSEIFASAKPGLHVINICRGEVLDDNALLDALERGQVSAATLDVTAPEPLPEGHPFYTHRQVRLTPHISWSSEDNADRIAAKLQGNLDRFLAGEPLTDVVVAGRGY
ncbi:NAD(P)-dependent oxidoreductase [Aliirhizobium smilacinae]|uniref:Hydroxyacid dehydrogenase n=1 Tax=Aliirhizobium smilacinae TaxID=1395944 RepID=A0A5C4X8Z0_9HYPH|nr:NAD(P)-dependent oxidoreductase [Rhizobium smilacinae]TNM59759.1 hydroxyacid dehydrogenase [Rhizobium smilacinae]